MSALRRDVFQAIADPTRRQIISLIAAQPMNLNDIAGNFEISRPGISQHIKILIECGLVTVRQQGRERYCEPSFKKMKEVSDWVNTYKKFWSAKLDALEEFLENENKHAKHKKLKHKKHGKKRKH